MVDERPGGGHFGLMLLLREGLPGWLTRREQLLGSKPAHGPPLAQNLVAPAFDDWVRVLSSLFIPTTGQVQHEC